jgi:hypothetical protein
MALPRLRHATKLLSIGRLLQWARKSASCAAGFRFSFCSLGRWRVAKFVIHMVKIPVLKQFRVCSFEHARSNDCCHFILAWFIQNGGPHSQRFAQSNLFYFVKNDLSDNLNDTDIWHFSFYVSQMSIIDSVKKSVYFLTKLVIHSLLTAVLGRVKFQNSRVEYTGLTCLSYNDVFDKLRMSSRGFSQMPSSSLDMAGRLVSMVLLMWYC